MSRTRFIYLSCFLMAAVMAVFTISCGPKPVQPLGWLDTPEHHTSTGIRLLQQEKCADAGREFDLALKLDPRYAKAAAGAGLVKACRETSRARRSRSIRRRDTPTAARRCSLPWRGNFGWMP